MAYLIDSDWAIDHLNREPRAVALLARLNTEGTFISIVTYIEVFQGVLRDPRPDEALRALQELIAGSPIVYVSMAAAERCARLRQHFLDQGQRPARRGFDLLIAATAIEHDLTLVTRNVSGLRRHTGPIAVPAGVSDPTAARPSPRSRS